MRFRAADKAAQLVQACGGGLIFKIGDPRLGGGLALLGPDLDSVGMCIGHREYPPCATLPLENAPARIPYNLSRVTAQTLDAFGWVQFLTA